MFSFQGMDYGGKKDGGSPRKLFVKEVQGFYNTAVENMGDDTLVESYRGKNILI